MNNFNLEIERHSLIEDGREFHWFDLCLMGKRVKKGRGFANNWFKIALVI